ncbi:MAG: hypothetical protein R6U44_03165 [Archaeoglobaceae archaeon]
MPWFSLVVHSNRLKNQRRILPPTPKYPKNLSFELGGVNFTGIVYQGDGERPLVVKLPNGYTINTTVSNNFTRSEVKYEIIDKVGLLRSDEVIAVQHGIIIECGKANGTACTQKANKFGRCIDKGMTEDECIKNINGSWKSEVSVSGYPLLQLQYKR